MKFGGGAWLRRPLLATPMRCLCHSLQCQLQ